MKKQNHTSLSDEGWKAFVDSIPQDITPSPKGPEWFAGIDQDDTIAIVEGDENDLIKLATVIGKHK